MPKKENPADKLAVSKSLASALRKRRLAVEAEELEDAPAIFSSELRIETDEDDKKKKKK